MDPILGRDDEIRQIIDVLMRRRQNNPILTGEAGVGKTAVVEGFAQRIAVGRRAAAAAGVRLCALDIGLMQAGASMKGEFEQRLRSVIDEVQSSPTPIILFIDEAHTLIGAGGAAGTGDAANLLKPALARGTLRTIAATTWSEYRQYFEKDPALTRRFQPIQVDEPDVARCCDMLRGVLGPMEKHHKVRISDAAIVAAVKLSHRYIPARQLPDKAVSLLDTACARVAISQSATPAAIEDAHVAHRCAREGEGGAWSPSAISAPPTRSASPRSMRKSRPSRTGSSSSRRNGAAEQGIVDGDPRPARKARRARRRRGRCRGRLRGDAAQALRERSNRLDPERRMIYAHVDEQAVASVVSDWTGIPVGRMVKDEIETVLDLAEILNRRVVGQSHGLEDDRQAHRDQPRQARQSEQADRRVHALRPVRRRQDRDGARARRGALRRRAEHDHHQHVASSRRRIPSRR